MNYPSLKRYHFNFYEQINTSLIIPRLYRFVKQGGTTMTTEERRMYNKAYREKNKEKLKAYNKQYYMDHLEQRKAYNRKWYKEYYNHYQEQCKARSRAYYATHKEQCKEWRAKNPDKLRQYRANYKLKSLKLSLQKV